VREPISSDLQYHPLETSRASKKTGPAASEGKRFDAITRARLISTCETTPNSRLLDVFLVPGFSKFHGPSGSETRLMTGCSNTSDLIR
jgi:hypothetical protein